MMAVLMLSLLGGPLLSPPLGMAVPSHRVVEMGLEGMVGFSKASLTVVAANLERLMEHQEPMVEKELMEAKELVEEKELLEDTVLPEVTVVKALLEILEELVDMDKEELDVALAAEITKVVHHSIKTSIQANNNAHI